MSKVEAIQCDGFDVEAPEGTTPEQCPNLSRPDPNQPRKPIEDGWRMYYGKWHLCPQCLNTAAEIVFIQTLMEKEKLEGQKV